MRVPAGNLEAIEAAMTTINHQTYTRIERGLNWPLWLPTSSSRQYKSAIAELDRRVLEIIDSTPADGPSLLAELRRARDDESQSQMTSKQLRNEVVALMVAGHETTANGLSWTWHLLSQHPEVEQRLHKELETVLGGRTPEPEDLRQLTYTSYVIRESTRLYPPIWAILRRVVKADVIGGYRIPAGSRIVISPYALHRREKFWKDPERFDPDRFRPERLESVPKFAYLPFGSGGRVCIGQNFAMFEAAVAVAMIAQRIKLHPTRFTAEPDPGIALRIKGGLPMRIERRGGD
jgi:cytochrome P450